MIFGDGLLLPSMHDLVNTSTTCNLFYNIHHLHGSGGDWPKGFGPILWSDLKSYFTTHVYTANPTTYNEILEKIKDKLIGYPVTFICNK